MKGSTTFYEKGAGDRLIDATVYPKSIMEYLAREEELMTAIADSFDVLVEIGCMHGRALDWALAHKKSYVGLDVAPRYIRKANELASIRGLDQSTYQFILGAAEQIDEWLDTVSFAQGKRCLLFYPFNCFGNMADPGEVLDGILRAKQPYMIGTYWTNDQATADRLDYYRSCYQEAVEVQLIPNGVLFCTADGLHTMSYHPDYLQSPFEERGLAVELVKLSSLGVAYCDPRMTDGLSGWSKGAQGHDK